MTVTAPQRQTAHAALDAPEMAEAIGRLRILGMREARHRWARADLLLWIERNTTHDDYIEALDRADIGLDTARRLRWMARKVPPDLRPPVWVMSWSAVMALAGLDNEDEGPVSVASSAVPPALLMARRFGFTSTTAAKALRDMLDGFDRALVIAALEMLEEGCPPGGNSPERREWVAQALLAMRRDLGLDRPPADMPDPTETPLTVFVRAEVLRQVPGARRLRILDQIMTATLRAARMWQERNA